MEKPTARGKELRKAIENKPAAVKLADMAAEMADFAKARLNGRKDIENGKITFIVSPQADTFDRIIEVRYKDHLSDSFVTQH